MKLWTPQRTIIDPKRRICSRCLKPTREWARANRHRMGSMLLAICCCEEDDPYCGPGGSGFPTSLDVTFSGVTPCDGCGNNLLYTVTTLSVNQLWAGVTYGGFSDASGRAYRVEGALGSIAGNRYSDADPSPSVAVCGAQCATVTARVLIDVYISCDNNVMKVKKLHGNHWKSSVTGTCSGGLGTHLWFNFVGLAEKGDTIPNNNNVGCAGGANGSGGTAVVEWS